MRHARSIVRRVCDIAGQVTWIDDLRYAAIDISLVAAVANRDTAAIFDWLIRELSHQGISDAVADGYMDRHGNVTWAEIEASLSTNPRCDKLQGVLGVYGLPVSQGCADLRQTERIRRLPATPASAPERAAQPKCVQLIPVHPGHCRRRHRHVD